MYCSVYGIALGRVYPRPRADGVLHYGAGEVWSLVQGRSLQIPGSNLGQGVRIKNPKEQQPCHFLRERLHVCQEAGDDQDTRPRSS